MRVLLFTNTITARLHYIAAFISDTFFSGQLELTDNFELYKETTGFKINYAAQRLTAAELHIQPTELLFEKNIVAQTIECFDWQGVKVFFRTGGDLSFDIFAATFYLLSRYEEYLPHIKDEFGRFSHINSLAYKEHFLQLPLINSWWQKLTAILNKQYQHPAFSIPPSAFRFIPTYDIDIAYSYLAKGALRNAGGVLKELSRRNWQAVRQRVAVLNKKVQDPFDTYDWLHGLHTKHRLQPIYFFLLAEKNKAFDKNNNPYSHLMQQLMQRHAKRYATGIHPSWQSADHAAILLREIELLELATGKPATNSRQHYIRMTLPDTYRLLIKAGISNDYSMGYGSINGFRASAASSFYWYDLEREETTKLLIHPFCYMEANSFFEQHYTSIEAAKELQQYHDITKQAGGNLITVFHNHFLTEEPAWLPWRKMYESFLNKNF